MLDQYLTDACHARLPRRRALALAVSLALAAGTAGAQDSDDEAAKGVVDEVVVTGQKIERSLQDTSTSVAVWDAQTIDEQNFITLGDVLSQTANVSSSFNDAIITIRGVRNIGASGEVASDVSAVYVDGVFLPRALFSSGALNLWDIQSAEVFRGPQSTVQGRNALAGAVVLNTVDPGYEFEGSGQIQLAEFDTWRMSGAVSVPLVSDQLALRLSLDEARSDGWIDNGTLGINDADASTVTTIRAKALWEPSFLPDLSVRLNYTNVDAFKAEGRVDINEFPERRITFENIQSRSTTESDIASLKVDYDLGDIWTLTSVSAYTEGTGPGVSDPTRDETGGDIEAVFFRDDEVFSQELRASFDGDRARGLFGLFYFTQEGSQSSDSASDVVTDDAFPDPFTFASLLFSTPTPNVGEVAIATGLRQQIVDLAPVFPVGFERASDLEIENYAIFGELELDLSDRWTVTLGARYDREDIAQGIIDNTIVPPISVGDPILDQILEELRTQFSNQITVGGVENEFDAWLPKVSATYNWSDSISTSFTYQRGYRAGGLSINVFRAALAAPGAEQAELEAAGVVNSFDPEFTNNYELAWRSQFADGRATLNANLFYIDYTDQQINVLLSSNPLDTLTENVGESELYGFEAEFSYLVNDNFEIGANLGFVNTEFTDGGDVLDDVIGGGLDLTGLEFTYAPKVTSGAYGRYESESGWYVNARVRYEDESFAVFDNDPQAINDSFTLVNLIAGYDAEDWRAEVFVNNLLDQDYFTANFGPNDNAINIAGDPRNIGARVVFTF